MLLLCHDEKLFFSVPALPPCRTCTFPVTLVQVCNWHDMKLPETGWIKVTLQTRNKTENRTQDLDFEVIFSLHLVLLPSKEQ